VAIAIASLAAVVWLVVALVVITDRGDKNSGSTGTGETLPAISSVSSPSTTTTPAESTAAPTNAATTTASTTTTLPPPLVIDLAVPAPTLAPQVLATFPIVDPNGARPSYVVTTDHHKRIVVLDMISADVSFADLATGAWTTYPSDIPVANWTGYFLIGPDDVLYMQMLDTGSGAAYALQDGRYVEVGHYPAGVGDQGVVAARTGPSVIGAGPLTPYFGADGSLSGAVLPDNDFVLTNAPSNHLVMSRGTRSWDVEVAHSTCESMCNTLNFGPRDDALVFSQLGTNRPTYRITWLSDTVRSWNTDWSFAGPVDAGLIVVNSSGDQFEIALAK
jgi:hypothetical protein